MFVMCAEKVLRLASIDCSSPMSAKIVRKTGSRDPLARPLNRGLRDVGAEHMAARAHARGELEQRRSAAAADIQHVFSVLRGGLIEGDLREPGKQRVDRLMTVGPGAGRGAVPIFRFPRIGAGVVICRRHGVVPGSRSVTAVSED